jgi:hypothetical protein
LEFPQTFYTSSAGEGECNRIISNLIDEKLQKLEAALRYSRIGSGWKI